MNPSPLDGYACFVGSIKSKFQLAVCLFLLCFSLPLMTACSTTQQAAFVTTAEKFGSDLISYAQTVSNAIQTVSNVVGQNSGVILSVLQSWGLMPANSGQLSTYNAIIADVQKAASSSATLNSVLTAISTTGKVPGATTGLWLPFQVTRKDLVG